MFPSTDRTFRARAVLNDGAATELSNDDIRDAELDRARHALSYLQRKLGNDAMRELLADDLDVTTRQVRSWSAASQGSWQAATVELIVEDLTAEAFHSWYRDTTKAGDASRFDPGREAALRSGHPEHFVNHPRPEGVEVIENVGETELPWRVVYQPLPPDADVPGGWDDDFPIRFGSSVLIDGECVGYSLRQLRDADDGMHLKLTTYLPAAAPASLVRRHLNHYAIEFRNWAWAARWSEPAAGR